MNQRWEAEKLNAKGMQHAERGELEEAAKLYRAAAERDPTWGTPLFNLGLVFKEQRRWEDSLECNRRAAQLEPENQPAWWNLGIAATALGRWDAAREAWRGFGIDVPEGEGPLDLPCGVGPIRLDPAGHAEVVWAWRIDPARARLASIPFPESGYRWKDVVLNDGDPRGYREYRGKQLPVLDAMELLTPSPAGLYVARLQTAGGDDSLAPLLKRALELGGCAEDWSTSVRILCKACSEGQVHEKHDQQAAPPEGVHVVAIAADDSSHAEAILADWPEAKSERRLESLEEVLAPRGAN